MIKATPCPTIFSPRAKMINNITATFGYLLIFFGKVLTTRLYLICEVYNSKSTPFMFVYLFLCFVCLRSCFLAFVFVLFDFFLCLRCCVFLVLVAVCLAVFVFVCLSTAHVWNKMRNVSRRKKTCAC